MKAEPLNYHTSQIVRGSASRTFLVVGSAGAVAVLFFVLALKFFVKRPVPDKTALIVGMAVFMMLLAGGASAVAALSVARIQDGHLDFLFCGFRTRRFPLDNQTTFELRKIGRARGLKIQRGKSWHIPNGTFRINALVELLRRNGVTERKS